MPHARENALEARVAGDRKQRLALSEAGVGVALFAWHGQTSLDRCQGQSFRGAVCRAGRYDMPKAIRFYQPGGPDVLMWEEVPVGKPGPGEARVRHTAVG